MTPRARPPRRAATAAHQDDSGGVTHPRLANGLHTPHPLHLDPTNDWVDANCYTDLWIELLHGLGLDPYPMLSFTLGIDFEGDQWTFFKPPPGDLSRLYGIEVIELAVYRSLCAHAAVQLRRGHVPVLEADAFFLPDVPATYHRTHSKTTVGIVSIDESVRVARYLHNSARFTVHGDDFDGLFRLRDHAPAAGVLPPFVEVAKLTAVRRADRDELRTTAWERAAAHVSRPDRAEAMDRFLATFEDDIARFRGDFDGYAFATLRQLGAACALAARFTHWLDGDADTGLVEAAGALEAASQSVKRLILKAARAVATGRALAADATYATLVESWRDAIDRTYRTLTGAGPPPTAEKEWGNGEQPS